VVRRLLIYQTIEGSNPARISLLHLCAEMLNLASLAPKSCFEKTIWPLNSFSFIHSSVRCFQSLTAYDFLKKNMSVICFVYFLYSILTIIRFQLRLLICQSLLHLFRHNIYMKHANIYIRQFLKSTTVLLIVQKESLN